MREAIAHLEGDQVQAKRQPAHLVCNQETRRQEKTSKMSE